MYSPMLCCFSQTGAAPTSSAPWWTSTGSGIQPVPGPTDPDRSSAARKACSQKGEGPEISRSQASGSTSRMESATVRRTTTM